MADNNITVVLHLTTDEAAAFATLLHRLNLDRLHQISWRGQGDTEITVTHWGAVVLRLRDELGRQGYTEVRA